MFLYYIFDEHLEYLNLKIDSRGNTVGTYVIPWTLEGKMQNAIHNYLKKSIFIFTDGNLLQQE